MALGHWLLGGHAGVRGGPTGIGGDVTDAASHDECGYEGEGSAHAGGLCSSQARFRLSYIQ